MLTRSLALEYGPRNIRAFGFAPGLVDTGMQWEIRASGFNPVGASPREGFADAALPAKAIGYLCSRGSDDLAGSEIDIRDAGLRQKAELPQQKS